MLRLYYLVLLSLFVVPLANGQAPTRLAGKPFPEKWAFVDSLYKHVPKGTKTRSALVNPYIEEAIAENDEELELLLKILQLQQKSWEHSISDSVFVTEIRRYTLKANKRGWNHIEAIAYHTNSMYWSENRNLAEAVKYAVKAYSLYYEFDYTYFIMKKAYIVELAQRYDAFDDVDNSLKYRYEAMTIPPENDYSSSIYNVLGLIHTDLGNYDSALYYFNKLHDIARDNGVKVWQVIAMGNTIDVFTEQGMYDSALQIAMHVLTLAEQYTGGDVAANLLSTIASIYQDMGNDQQAAEYYDKALNRYRSRDANWYYDNLYAARRLYKNFSELKAEQGNYRLAYAYIDTLLLVSDSITKRYNISQLKSVEKELGETKLDNANQLLSIEKKNAQLQRNLLISVVLVATLIILFISFWYSKRKERLEASRSRAESDLQASQDKLAAFTGSIQEKNKLLVNLEQKLTEYETNEKTIDLAETISKLHETTILSDHDWVYFKAIFEKAHPGYLTRLKGKCPDLTQAEIRYIVLSKLGMSTKEMAGVLGVATGSIRSTKSRILKKLALQNDEDLKNLIDSI